MLYYKKTEEGEWMKYEERTWLAVLSWIWLIAILSLHFDLVGGPVYGSIEDGYQTLLFVILLLIFAIMIAISKIEPIVIKWRRKVYSRPESDYIASEKAGIFTAPYPKWFKIRKNEPKTF